MTIRTMKLIREAHTELEALRILENYEEKLLKEYVVVCGPECAKAIKSKSNKFRRKSDE